MSYAYAFADKGPDNTFDLDFVGHLPGYPGTGHSICSLPFRPTESLPAFLRASEKRARESACGANYRERERARESECVCVREREREREREQ